MILPLAVTAREKLSESQIKEALNDLKAMPAEIKERIAEDLSKAIEVAPRDIIKKDYRGILAPRAKEFIDLGLAVYG
jgi:hypothetical protein